MKRVTIWLFVTALLAAACSGVTRTSDSSPPEDPGQPIEDPVQAANPVEGKEVFFVISDFAAAQARCSDRQLPEWIHFDDGDMLVFYPGAQDYVDLPGTYSYRPDDDLDNLGLLDIRHDNGERTLIMMTFDRHDLGTFVFSTVRGDINNVLCTFDGRFQTWDGPPHDTDAWPLLDVHVHESVAGLATPDAPAPPAALIWIENLTSQTMEVFFIDREGAQIHFATMPPGNTWMAYTYVGHVWALRDEAGSYRVFAALSPGEWRARIET